MFVFHEDFLCPHAVWLLCLCLCLCWAIWTDLLKPWALSFAEFMCCQFIFFPRSIVWCVCLWRWGKGQNPDRPSAAFPGYLTPTWPLVLLISVCRYCRCNGTPQALGRFSYFSFPFSPFFYPTRIPSSSNNSHSSLLCHSFTAFFFLSVYFFLTLPSLPPFISSSSCSSALCTSLGVPKSEINELTVFYLFAPSFFLFSRRSFSSVIIPFF